LQAEDGMRDFHVTGVQTCALPIWLTGASSITSGTRFGEPFQMSMMYSSSSFRSDVMELAPVSRPVVGTAYVPGSKSITNRALLRSEERRVGRDGSVGWHT